MGGFKHLNNYNYLPPTHWSVDTDAQSQGIECEMSDQ